MSNFGNKVLLKEKGWILRGTDTTSADGIYGWSAVIEHECRLIKDSPYWMLLEYADQPTTCTGCKAIMPVGIVVLFKFLNWEMIK